MVLWESLPVVLTSDVWQAHPCQVGYQSAAPGEGAASGLSPEAVTATLSSQQLGTLTFAGCSLLSRPWLYSPACD